MTDLTPRQMLDPIDRALDEAARLAVECPRDRHPPERIDRPTKPMEQMTPREILDALDRALEKAAHIARKNSNGQTSATARNPT